MLLVGAGITLYLRPIPAFSLTPTPIKTPVAQPALAWPSQGAAAVGILNHGVLAATANQKPLPTASIAKVMTALAVLKKHPLKPGEQGPMIPITQEAVNLYSSYSAQGGSTVPVAVGEQISEYQALQAMLLPSANNIADVMAVWAYGSMEKYHMAAMELAHSLAMKHSKFAGDASGFLPATTSTPSDLVLLGEAALNNAVIREIVAQPEVNLPVAGVVKNVNWLVGMNGFIGIKTGNTDEAGGCFLFATTRMVSGQNVTVVGAIMAQPILHEALLASEPLMDSVYQGIGPIRIAKKGQTVAKIQTQWGKTVDISAGQDITTIGWKGNQPTTSVTLTDQSSDAQGQEIGTFKTHTEIETKSSPLVIDTPLLSPSIIWRLTYIR